MCQFCLIPGTTQVSTPNPAIHLPLRVRVPTLIGLQAQIDFCLAHDSLIEEYAVAERRYSDSLDITDMKTTPIDTYIGMMKEPRQDLKHTKWGLLNRTPMNRPGKKDMIEILEHHINAVLHGGRLGPLLLNVEFWKYTLHLRSLQCFTSHDFTWHLEHPLWMDCCRRFWWHHSGARR